MKVSDLKELNREELDVKKKELLQQLSQLKFQNATNQLENPIMIRSVRRDIARVKTILKQKEGE
ncbi:MAG: 50S ribosomal protein L29 [Thermodesulfobacteriota bacterium]